MKQKKKKNWNIKKIFVYFFISVSLQVIRIFKTSFQIIEIRVDIRRKTTREYTYNDYSQ